MKIGLVLEGGGMRGLYTAGVLDTMMAQKWQPDYVVGVSAEPAMQLPLSAGSVGELIEPTWIIWGTNAI